MEIARRISGNTRRICGTSALFERSLLISQMALTRFCTLQSLQPVNANLCSSHNALSMPHNPHTCPLINPSVAPRPLTSSICTNTNTKPSIPPSYPKPHLRQDPHRIDDRRQGSRKRASRVYALHKIFPRKDVSSALDSRSHEIRPPITGALREYMCHLHPEAGPLARLSWPRWNRGVRNVITGSQPCLPMIWRDGVGVGLQLQPRERVK